MVRLHRSPIPVGKRGVFPRSNDFYLPSLQIEEGERGKGRHPVLKCQKATHPSLILGRPADVLSPPPSPFSAAIFQGSLYMSGGRVRIFRPATLLWTAPSFCSRLAAAAAFRLSAKNFRFSFRLSAKAFCFSALAFRFSAAASRFAAATAFIIFLRVETEGF
jgi:hypothetical protein